MEKFIQYMQGRNYSETTQKMYLRSVNLFLEWIDKEQTQITKKDVLKYLEYLKTQKNLKNVSRKMELTGINHYFTFLYQSEQTTQNPCSFLKIRGIEKVSLYRTFTPEQLTQLFDDYYTVFVKNYDYTRTPPNRLTETKLNKERNAVILNLLIHQGATTKEIDKMLLQDIDLIKATVKIRGGKRSNERNLQLKAEQIGLLINYIQNIRPQFLTSRNQESEKLFFPYPNTGNQKSRNPEGITDLFKPLTNQVKTIESHFINFKQVRASVITNWLKVHGLRKTQYMAGHRYIRGTEYYLPNNLEDLTNDISKHHPF
jgi:site-specific recombinase XerD